MKIDVLTIFPEMFSGPLTESLIGKALKKKIVEIKITDIRSFTKDKHHIVDDRPFGGGPGMVMKPEPAFAAFRHLGINPGKKQTEWPAKNRPLVVYLSPQGKKLSHERAKRFAGYKRLVLLCGHYEGVDERIMKLVDQEISIGDYVLTGGELPAMVLIDAVLRFLPGVVKEISSVEQDSFCNGLLDYPHYTRPSEFNKMKVPGVLLSGNHKEIDKWRAEQSLTNTLRKRPDLLKNIKLSEEQIKIFKTLRKQVRK
ncbi:MAG: tRNA (guanosine(37)-N1)-methyltransferase TrmD [Elusimicrobiota bacterium]